MPTYSWHLSSVPRRGDCLPPYNQPQFCHYGGERGRGETLLGEALHPFRVRKAIKSSRAEPDEPDGFPGGHSHLMHLHSQGPARLRAERTQPRQGGPAGAGAPTAAGWGVLLAVWARAPAPRACSAADASPAQPRAECLLRATLESNDRCHCGCGPGLLRPDAGPKLGVPRVTWRRPERRAEERVREASEHSVTI